MDENCRLKADGQAHPRAAKPVAGEAGTREVRRPARVRWIRTATGSGDAR